MNEDEFWSAYRAAEPQPRPDPRQAYYASLNALEEIAARATYAGRVMLGSALASIAFGTITASAIHQDDIRTGTLAGLLAGGFALGAAYARHKAGQHLCEETQLRIKHIPIKAAYDAQLKQEDLNQRRSQKRS
ncbi:hypothetical protein C4580_02550 [Candidatus Woesearchaeota archaeon]|nr:MAG: hypothetical protein C4580_02550 [Candidatus Woesearchaeota archaeon]